MVDWTKFAQFRGCEMQHMMSMMQLQYVSVISWSPLIGSRKICSSGIYHEIVENSHSWTQM